MEKSKCFLLSDQTEEHEDFEIHAIFHKEFSFFPHGLPWTNFV